MTAPVRAGKGRRSAVQAQSTRDAIVEVAGELFADHGYIQTSIRDIARRAGVTTGAVYGHFRNKADLLAEAVNSRIADELEAITRARPGVRDHVDALVRHARNWRKRRQLRALLVQGAAAAPTDQETRIGLRNEQLAHLQLWVDGYQRERDRLGIDPHVDIETAVLFTWAVELGLGVLEAFGIEPSSADAWADVQARMAQSLRFPPAGKP